MKKNMPNTILDLLKKEESAFQPLKVLRSTNTSTTEESKDFIVYCDASHHGLGADLMQRSKVIAYASQQLKKT